jgi:hypothetical protein
MRTPGEKARRHLSLGRAGEGGRTLRNSPDSPGNPHVYSISGSAQGSKVSDCGAPDAELQAVVEAWPALSASTRASIMALAVKA